MRLQCKCLDYLDLKSRLYFLKSRIITASRIKNDTTTYGPRNNSLYLKNRRKGTRRRKYAPISKYKRNLYPETISLREFGSLTESSSDIGTSGHFIHKFAYNSFPSKGHGDFQFSKPAVRMEFPEHECQDRSVEPGAFSNSCRRVAVASNDNYAGTHGRDRRTLQGWESFTVLNKEVFRKMQTKNKKMSSPQTREKDRGSGNNIFPAKKELLRNEIVKLDEELRGIRSLRESRPDLYGYYDEFLVKKLLKLVPKYRRKYHENPLEVSQ